jgi:N-acetylglucosamine-6-sulfatase
MHGHDLAPLLKDPAGPWPHPAFYEFTGERYGREIAKIVNESPAKAVYHQVPWYVVMREDRWKYIRYLEPGQIEELYDLQNDPEELVNVAAETANQPVIAKLRESLNAELKRTEAGFTIDSRR